jgi:hypothetical protein
VGTPLNVEARAAPLIAVIIDCDEHSSRYVLYIRFKLRQLVTIIKEG